MGRTHTLIVKELKEDVIFGKGGFLTVLYCLILSVFSLVLVSNRELSLLDSSQAVYMMSNLVLAIAVLTALLRGSDGLAGERERGTLETLLITPVTARQVAFWKLGGILISWFFSYVLSVPYLWAVGASGHNLVPCLKYLFVVGTLLTLIFGAFSLTLSASMKSSKGALTLSLTLFLLLGSPVVLLPSLRSHQIGRILDLVNPFASAVNTMDSVVVDSQGFLFQWLRLTIISLYALAVLLFLAWNTRRVEL